MIDKETFQQQKIEELTGLYNQQQTLIVESAKLLKNNTNKIEVFSTIFTNCFKIRMLEVQKQIIISRPFPKKEWNKGGSAIVRETGLEYINHLPITSSVLPKGTI